MSKVNSKTDSPVIVALDYSSSEDALIMASKLDPKRCRVKVGKELFAENLNLFLILERGVCRPVIVSKVLY